MEYVASISYGKDSLAMLEAIKILDYPLDRIITAEVWATDTIQADLPPMIEFKEYADKVIKERYGIEVEHFRAKDKNGDNITYENVFYRELGSRGKKKREQDGKESNIYGFPIVIGAWCNSKLKVATLQEATNRQELGEDTNIVQYIGIACDETERVERHKKDQSKKMPLVDIGWDEAYCRKWCEENNLLSPIYKDSSRGGCWFCHNQGIDQLRLLRKNYPELWELLMKWDLDSPVSFKADGHTVHDFDKRFQLEDEGIITKSMNFRWNLLDQSNEIQTKLY